MRRFVTELLVFALLQAGVFWAVWTQCPRRADHYAAASIDKRARLETAPAPRIILVGGSSMAFGVDSRLFEARGWAPVNMGHNRSLGLSFMLAQVEGSLRSGDVVVVSPEYLLFWGGGVDETLITHLEHDPANLRFLDFDTCRRLSDTGLVWIARKLRCALHRVATDAPIAYSRYAFDEHGDFVAHRGKPPSKKAAMPMKWPIEKLRIDDRIERLQTFAARCASAGARCAFAFPPLREDAWRSGHEVVAAIEARIARDLRMPVVVSPRDALYPAEDFFDAGDHLTADAAQDRTRRLISGLERLGWAP